MFSCVCSIHWAIYGAWLSFSRVKTQMPFFFTYISDLVCPKFLQAPATACLHFLKFLWVRKAPLRLWGLICCIATASTALYLVGPLTPNVLSIWLKSCGGENQCKVSLTLLCYFPPHTGVIWFLCFCFYNSYTYAHILINISAQSIEHNKHLLMVPS